jgi:hypothetical protein
MKLKYIPLLLLSVALVSVLVGCSRESQPSETPTLLPIATYTPVTSAPTLTATPASTPTASEAEYLCGRKGQESLCWSKRYLQSIAGCLSRTLGEERATKIVKNQEQPTNEETATISGCSKPGGADQSSDDRSRSSAGKDQMPTGKDRSPARGRDTGTGWRISPTQVGCMFDAIGKSAYRDIRNGIRPPASAEIQTAQPCLPGSRSLNDVPHPLGAEQCPSLELLQRNLEEYQPRWDQLECHIKEDFQRLPLPSFRTSARINPIVLMEPAGAELGCQGLLCPEGTEGVAIKDLWNGDLAVLLESMEAETWEEFAGGRYTGSRLDHVTSLLFTEAEFPSANFTYLPGNVFKPKTDEIGERHVFPVTDYWHDVGLRAFAVHVILRKQAGHITPMEFGFGGSKDVPTAKTPEEFRNWIDEVFIPQKIHEAKIAEKLKIETYKPWMTEVDVWVMDQSWALKASDQELLETGQYLLDAVVAAVRPHFRGRITPHTWQHGSAVHEGHPRPIWKKLTFKGLDEVGVTFLPRCDMETTMADAKVQFAAIMEMVKRDSIPWVISEMDSNHKGFAFCGTDMFDQADEIWSAVFDLISELEIQPIGISTKGFGNIYSQEHKALIEEKLFSRSAS